MLFGYQAADDVTTPLSLSKNPINLGRQNRRNSRFDAPLHVAEIGLGVESEDMQLASALLAASSPSAASRSATRASRIENSGIPGAPVWLPPEPAERPLKRIQK